MVAPELKLAYFGGAYSTWLSDLTLLMKARKIITGSILILILVALGACSSIKMTYKQLDWLMPWYLDDFVELNDAHQQAFEEELKRFLKWHRTQQLPEYANFLDWAAASLDDGVDEVEINSIYLEIRGYGNVVIHEGIKRTKKLIRDMDEQEVAGLFSNLQQQNSELSERYVETAEPEQRRVRAEKMMENVEKWIGSLQPKQTQLIEQWSQTYQLMGPEYIESRLVWQQRLKQILEHRKDNAQLDEELFALWRDRENRRTQSFRLKHQRNHALLVQLYLDLDRSLSSQQRHHLVRRLRSIAADFRELAATD
jgi:hypothetical protein